VPQTPKRPPWNPVAAETTTRNGVRSFHWQERKMAVGGSSIFHRPWGRESPPELSAASHELRAQPIGPVDPASLIVAARVPLSTHFEHDWQWWQCGSVAVRKLLLNI
jgi:hypothetical protein